VILYLTGLIIGCYLLLTGHVIE